MRCLLDSHTYLWWVTDDPRLSEFARRVLGDAETRAWVSAATIWELAIKAKLGKLTFDDEAAAVLFAPQRSEFEALNITPAHAATAGALHRHHNDPFDRMLIAQAKCEGLTILTRDHAFAHYQVDIAW